MSFTNFSLQLSNKAERFLKENVEGQMKTVVHTACYYVKEEPLSEKTETYYSLLYLPSGKFFTMEPAIHYEYKRYPLKNGRVVIEDMQSIFDRDGMRYFLILRYEDTQEIVKESL